MPGSATITINGTRWYASIASTPAECAQGLGGISSLPAGWGMLFDLGFSQQVTVTTRPMLFDLDIIFLDENLQVTDVFRNVTPGREITTECRYFLEVNADEASGVEVGDQAQVSLTALELPPIDGPVDILGPAVLVFSIMTIVSAGFSALGKY